MYNVSRTTKVCCISSTYLKIGHIRLVYSLQVSSAVTYVWFIGYTNIYHHHSISQHATPLSTTEKTGF